MGCELGKEPTGGPSKSISSGRNQIGHRYARHPIILPFNALDSRQPSRDATICFEGCRPARVVVGVMGENDRGNIVGMYQVPIDTTAGQSPHGEQP